LIQNFAIAHHFVNDVRIYTAVRRGSVGAIRTESRYSQLRARGTPVANLVEGVALAEHFE
jgi:hypothetical protein